LHIYYEDLKASMISSVCVILRGFAETQIVPLTLLPRKPAFNAFSHCYHQRAMFARRDARAAVNALPRVNFHPLAARNRADRTSFHATDARPRRLAARARLALAVLPATVGIVDLNWHNNFIKMR